MSKPERGVDAKTRNQTEAQCTAVVLWDKSPHELKSKTSLSPCNSLDNIKGKQ